MGDLRIEVPGSAWQGRINVRTGMRWSRARSTAKCYLDEVAQMTTASVARQGLHFPSGGLEVWLTLVVPDRRRRDIDGPIKAILDGVTQGGGWGDDSQVEVLHVRRVVRKGEASAVLIVRALTPRGAAC